ncbi:MAG: PilZ domain-containing protein [bacterium]|nr:PilZ domain-containing protein [bacterium]
MSDSRNPDPDPPRRERRRRVRRPLTLTLFGIAFLLMPLINYVAIALRAGIPVSDVAGVFARLNLFEIVLLFGSVPVAIGLLLVKKWGWWTFLAYACALIVYNATVFALQPFAGNLGAVLLALFGMLAVAYIMRNDISAPYIKMYPRGWRLQKRKPLVFEIVADDIMRRTKDAHERGVYIEWPECSLEPGAEVTLAFRLNDNRYDLTGGVVRTDPEGVGVAFRDIDLNTLFSLRHDLREQTRI